MGAFQTASLTIEVWRVCLVQDDSAVHFAPIVRKCSEQHAASREKYREYRRIDRNFRLGAAVSTADSADEIGLE